MRGPLILNGPAQWELPVRSYKHWFDGLAMLHRFEIGAGPVHYRSRFLRSEDARKSHAAGRPEFGGYDTPAAGGLLSRLLHLANPRRSDNGCVVPFRAHGEWFALTASRAVIRECAWRAHPPRFLLSGESYSKHFDWLPQGGPGCIRSVCPTARCGPGTHRR